jgi:hypothetical protein
MPSPIHVCVLNSVCARAVHVLVNGTNGVGLTELTQKCGLSQVESPERNPENTELLLCLEFESD